MKPQRKCRWVKQRYGVSDVYICVCDNTYTYVPIPIISDTFQTILGMFRASWTVRPCLSACWVLGYCQLFLPKLDVGKEKARKGKEKRRKRGRKKKNAFTQKWRCGNRTTKGWWPAVPFLQSDESWAGHSLSSPQEGELLGVVRPHRGGGAAESGGPWGRPALTQQGVGQTCTSLFTLGFP